MDFKTLKDILTLADVVDIMKRLGVGDITPLQGQDGFICRTICHNAHGGSHKLYYYHQDQIFHCYTECGSMDIIELVNRVKGYDNLNVSMRFIATQLGIDIHSFGFNNNKSEMISDWSFINSLYKKKKTKSIINLPVVDSMVMNKFQNLYAQLWIDDGISIESMRKYNIKYSSGQQQIIIPHYSEDGELIGIRARNLNEDICEMYGKYLPYRDLKGVQYNHPLSLNLFGLDKNKETIKRLKKVMICESEFRSYLLFL